MPSDANDPFSSVLLVFGLSLDVTPFYHCGSAIREDPTAPGHRGRGAFGRAVGGPGAAGGASAAGTESRRHAERSKGPNPTGAGGRDEVRQGGPVAARARRQE